MPGGENIPSDNVSGHPDFPRVRVGVSSCLVGEPVRFDGGHKRDRYLTETLNRYFDFVPVCPEMAIGLGTPRPTVQLVGDIQNPRLVGTKDADLDVTEAMQLSLIHI